MICCSLIDFSWNILSEYLAGGCFSSQILVYIVVLETMTHLTRALYPGDHHL